MRAILTLTLFSTVLLFSQSLNASSRQAASEKKQEEKGRWEVSITVNEPKAEISSNFGSILGDIFSDRYEEESVSAEVSFNYIPENGSNPTPVSTTCNLSEQSSGFLSGTLKPTSGSLFNLYFSHYRLLTCSQKNENKEGLFKKVSLFTSRPYDITRKSNTKIEGEVIATHITTTKLSISSNQEDSEHIKGDANTLAFEPREYNSGVIAHSESYATKAKKDPKQNEASVTYKFQGTIKLNNVATDAITEINSNMTIDKDSIKGELEE